MDPREVPRCTFEAKTRYKRVWRLKRKTKTNNIIINSDRNILRTKYIDVM